MFCFPKKKIQPPPAKGEDTQELDFLGVAFPPLCDKHRWFSLKSGSSASQRIEVEDRYICDRITNSRTNCEVWMARYQDKTKPAKKKLRVTLEVWEKAKTPLAELSHEIAVLRYLQSCPFIVQLANCFQTPTAYVIGMKYATRGTLNDRVKIVRCVSEIIARFYAAEIAEGLFFLHQRGIIHRDLNLDDVLVCENGHIVLSNFTLSLAVREEAFNDVFPPWPGGSTNVHHPSPEMVLRLGYDKTVDWWALGVILHRMICGQHPFKKPKGVQALLDVETVYPPQHYPYYVSEPAKSILSQLLARQRGSRLGSGPCEDLDVSNATFFYHVDWSQLRDSTLTAPFSFLVHSAFHRPKRLTANLWGAHHHLPLSYMSPEQCNKPWADAISPGVNVSSRKTTGAVNVSSRKTTCAVKNKH